MESFRLVIDWAFSEVSGNTISALALPLGLLLFVFSELFFL